MSLWHLRLSYLLKRVSTFILWGWKGKQGSGIRSRAGGSMYVFAEILRILDRALWAYSYINDEP